MKQRVFYTDGSCSCNPGPGGYAVVEFQNKNNKLSINYIAYFQSENTTNNREELKAIIHVLKHFSSLNEDIIIYSDSAYCVNMLNSWIWNWVNNNWKNSKKREVENIDLVKQAYDYLKEYGGHIIINKVPGHTGIIENEIVDAVASGNKQKYITLCRKYNIEEDFYF